MVAAANATNPQTPQTHKKRHISALNIDLDLDLIFFAAARFSKQDNTRPNGERQKSLATETFTTGPQTHGAHDQRHIPALSQRVQKGPGAASVPQGHLL